MTKSLSLLLLAFLLCSCAVPNPKIKIELDTTQSNDTKEIWKISGESEYKCCANYVLYHSKEEIQQAMRVAAAKKSNAEGMDCFLIDWKYVGTYLNSETWNVIFHKRDKCDELKKTKWRESTFYNDDIVKSQKKQMPQYTQQQVQYYRYEEDPISQQGRAAITNTNETPIIQQERIAIINTVDNNDSIGFSDLAFLTSRLRETAVNVLPKSRYGVMTTESIVAFLGSQENARKVCNEASCLAEIGRKVSADYVAQARIGRFNGYLTIGVELYSVKSGVMVGSFTGGSKDVSGLLSIINEKAPDLFKQMPR